jgi:glutathione S-transferase
MRTLWVISYSPWSERARWALLHHGVEFTERQHLPLVGEPLLRWRARSSRASVPLLVEDDRRIMDSRAIAERAEELGKGKPLFLAEHRGEIARFDDEVEPMMSAARGIIVHNVATDPAASLEGLPRALRGMPLGARTAAIAARYVGNKYGAKIEGAREVCRTGLLALRARIGGRKYVYDTFTFADVIAATALQFVSPVSNDIIRLGPATRRAWTEESLAAEFADLVSWRDAIYAEHRPRVSRSH